MKGDGGVSCRLEFPAAREQGPEPPLLVAGESAPAVLHVAAMPHLAPDLRTVHVDVRVMDPPRQRGRDAAREGGAGGRHSRTGAHGADHVLHRSSQLCHLVAAAPAPSRAADGESEDHRPDSQRGVAENGEEEVMHLQTPLRFSVPSLAPAGHRRAEGRHTRTFLLSVRVDSAQEGAELGHVRDIGDHSGRTSYRDLLHPLASLAQAPPGALSSLHAPGSTSNASLAASPAGASQAGGRGAGVVLRAETRVTVLTPWRWRCRHKHSGRSLELGHGFSSHAAEVDSAWVAGPAGEDSAHEGTALVSGAELPVHLRPGDALTLHIPGTDATPCTAAVRWRAPGIVDEWVTTELAVPAWSPPSPGRGTHGAPTAQPSAAAARPCPLRLVVETLPRRVTRGVPFCATLSLENRSAHPLRSAVLRFAHPDGATAPAWEQVGTESVPLSLLPAASRLPAGPLPAGSRQHISVSCVALGRGRHALPGVVLHVVDEGGCRSRYACALAAGGHVAEAETDADVEEPPR